jgi:NitT/TauT family transport system permease protein
MKASKTSSPFLDELIGFGLLVAVWALLSLFFPVYVIPSPLEIIRSLPTFLKPGLIEAIGITSFRIIVGFLLSILVGYFLAVWLYNRRLGQYLSSMLQAFQVLPAITVGVILVIIFGIGYLPPIGLTFLMTLPVITLNTIQALNSTKSELDEYLASLKADRETYYRFLLKPALLRVTKSNLLLGFGLAIKIVIMGEFIGSQDGIGYLLNRARLVFNMKEVFFYLIILLILTLFFQAIVNLLYSGPLKRYSYD